MTNVPLIFQPLARYADFNGRSRRSEFWLWVLFCYILKSAIATIAVTVMFSTMMPAFTTPPADPQVFMRHYFSGWMTMMPLLSLVNLALLIPSLAVGVRRLHDIGRTGWWLIMPHVVALIGICAFMVFFGTQIFSLAGTKEMTDEQGIKFAFGMFGSLFLFVVLPALIAWIVMLVFFVTEGKRGPNRFGPDPKGEALNDTP